MQVGACRSRRMQTVFQITAGEHSMRALSPLVSCGVAAQVETVTAVNSAVRLKIGRAACRERGWQYLWVLVVDVSLNTHNVSHQLNLTYLKILYDSYE